MQKQDGPVAVWGQTCRSTEDLVAEVARIGTFAAGCHVREICVGRRHRVYDIGTWVGDQKDILSQKESILELGII